MKRFCLHRLAASFTRWRFGGNAIRLGVRTLALSRRFPSRRSLTFTPSFPSRASSVLWTGPTPDLGSPPCSGCPLHSVPIADRSMVPVGPCIIFFQTSLFQWIGHSRVFSSVGTDDSSSISKIYIKTLKKAWSIAETLYPKRALHFPSILSQEEVTQLIDAALTPYHRILLLTLYATGVRNAELTHLEVEPISS